MSDSITIANGLRIEHVILFVMLSMFPLDSVTSLAGSSDIKHEGLTIARASMLLLFVVCVLRALISKDVSFLRLIFGSPVSILACTYIAVSVMSILVSRKPSNALNPMMTRLVMFTLYLMIIHICRTRRSLRLAILGLVAGILLSTIAGVYEIVTDRPVVKEVREGNITKESLYNKANKKYRIRGFCYDPDTHAFYLLVGLGPLLYLVHTSRSRSWSFLGAGLLGLVIVNIIATASRAAWLGLVLVLIGFYIITPLRQKRLYILGMFCTIIALFFAIVLFFPKSAVLDKMLDRSGTGSYGTEYRVDHLRIAMEMGRQNLLLGVGMGNYREEFHRFYRVTHVMTKKVPPFPHNIYAAVFAENGILGLGIYSLTNLAVLLQVLACIYILPGRDTKIMAIGVLLSFLAFIYCGNFYNVLDSKYCWTSMAFAGSLWQILRTERETQSVEG